MYLCYTGIIMWAFWIIVIVKTITRCLSLGNIIFPSPAIQYFLTFSLIFKSFFAKCPGDFYPTSDYFRTTAPQMCPVHFPYHTNLSWIRFVCLWSKALSGCRLSITSHTEVVYNLSLYLPDGRVQLLYFFRLRWNHWFLLEPLFICLFLLRCSLYSCFWLLLSPRPCGKKRKINSSKIFPSSYHND